MFEFVLFFRALLGERSQNTGAPRPRVCLMRKMIGKSKHFAVLVREEKSGADLDMAERLPVRFPRPIYQEHVFFNPIHRLLLINHDSIPL